MARTITTIDERSSLALPSEAMDGLGVEAGAELDIQVGPRCGRSLHRRSPAFPRCSLMHSNPS